MSEEKGIKEVKEVVEFIAVLASAADLASKDGLGLEDIGLFMPVMALAPAAFTGLDEAKLEAGNLSQQELVELKVALAEKLDLADDKLEGLIEKALGLAVSVYGFIQEVRVLKDA
jgi:hypothetical protein